MDALIAAAVSATLILIAYSFGRTMGRDVSATLIRTAYTMGRDQTIRTLQRMDKVAAYYPHADLIVLNPAHLRHNTIKRYLYVALHERYHMMMHSDYTKYVESEATPEMEKAADEWATNMMNFILEKVDIELMEKMNPQ